MATRRVVAAALAAMLIAAAVGCSSSDGDPSGGTKAQTTGSQPTGKTSDLPVGDDSSPYRVAHDLPKGYRLVTVDEVDNDPIIPFEGSHLTRYHDGVGDDGDANLSIRTSEQLLQSRPMDEGGMSPEFTEEMLPLYVEQTEGRIRTIEGRTAYEVPMHGEGRIFGTAIFWKEPGGLWVAALAAEPLTARDAERALVSAKPFPADRWDDLARAAHRWVLEREEYGPMDRREVGSGRAAGKEWVLSSLVPKDWGELSVERRPACWTFAYAGEEHDGFECSDQAATFELGGVRFAVGEAPKATTRVQIVELTPGEDPAGGKVDATIVPGPKLGPDIVYWVAEVPKDWCLYRPRFTPSDEPEDTFDQLIPYQENPLNPTPPDPDALPERSPEVPAHAC